MIDSEKIIKQNGKLFFEGKEVEIDKEKQIEEDSKKLRNRESLGKPIYFKFKNNG